MVMSGWCPAFSATSAILFTRLMAGGNDFSVYRFWIDFPTCDQPRMSFSFCWISFLLSAAIAPPALAAFAVEYKKPGETSQRKLGMAIQREPVPPGRSWVLPALRVQGRALLVAGEMSEWCRMASSHCGGTSAN